MSFKLLGGGSDLGTIVNDVNQNILELKGREVTEIFKDDTGVRRVLLGKGPNGFYGLLVSKPGFDVFEATADQLIFTSGQNVFKIVGVGTLEVAAPSLNTGGANYAVGTTEITEVAHGLSFVPAVIAFWTDGSGSYIPLPWTSSSSWGSGGFSFSEIRIITDSTNVTGLSTLYGFNKNIISSETTIKYYLLQETAN